MLARMQAMLALRCLDLQAMASILLLWLSRTLYIHALLGSMRDWYRCHRQRAVALLVGLGVRKRTRPTRPAYLSDYNCIADSCSSSPPVGLPMCTSAIALCAVKQGNDAGRRLSDFVSTLVLTEIINETQLCCLATLQE